MKFYFCETCGRRITDAQVARGEGRDKKLRGVYCSECAVAVSTLDTLPVTDTEARQLISEEHGGVRRGSGGARRPASGPKNTPEDNRGRSRLRETSANELEPLPIRSPLGKVAAIVVATCVATVLILFVAMTPGDRAKTPKAKKLKSAGISKKTDLKEAVASDPKKSPTSDSVESSGTAKQRPPSGAKVAPPREQQARTALEALIKKLQLMSEGDRTARIKALESFIQEYRHTGASVRARRLINDLKRRPGKTGPADASKTRDPAVEAKKKELREKAALQAARDKALKAANEKLATAIETLIHALKKADWPGVQALVGLPKDPGMGPVAEKAASLASCAQVFLDIEAGMKKKTEGLLDGKARSIRTKKKVVQGVITKYERDAFHVRVRGSVNGNPIEYGRIIRFSDLSDKGREELLFVFRPAKPEEWAAQAFREMLAGQLDTAARCLKQAGTFPLVGEIQARIDRTRIQAKESGARDAWKALEALREQKKWKAVRTALREFDTMHGATDFGKGKGTERVAWSKQTEDEILRKEGLVFDFQSPENQKLFRGTFSKSDRFNMELDFRDGTAHLFNKGRPAGTDRDGHSILFVAPHIILGSKWTLTCRLKLPKKALHRRAFDVCFLDPAKKKIRSGASNDRFTCHLSDVARVTLGLGFQNAAKVGAFFSPKQNRGVFGKVPGAQVEKRNLRRQEGKWKDDVYTLILNMNGDRFEASVEGDVMVSTTLTPQARAAIEKSPLAIQARLGNVGLQKLTFIKRDEGAKK